METSQELLFYLGIPLDYFEELKGYYYIPENKINELQESLYIIFISKFIYPKKIIKGKIKEINNNKIKINNTKNIVYNDYHLFCKPKLKINKALLLLQSSLEN